MKHLIIIGVGGFAREVYWHAQDSLGYGLEWDIKGFLDGDVKLPCEEYAKLELPVLGDVNSYIPEQDDVFVCAVASPEGKRKLIGIMKDKGAEFISLVHRTTIIHGNAHVGHGVIIVPYVTVHDHARIGDYVTINGRVGMGHDAEVGDYSCVMGCVDILGWAHVGRDVFLANGARILPHAVVEDGAYVGVASVVFKRVKAGKKVFGNPAVEI